MQSSFYASGFLYHLKTHQVLLLQSKQLDELTSLWSTIEGDGKEGEESQVTFQRLINTLLDINLKPKDIHPIYDYFDDNKKKLNYVFYAEVRSTKSIYKLKDGLSWFTFSETSKLPFKSQTKQDLVVAERVINAKWRDDEAKNPEPQIQP